MLQGIAQLEIVFICAHMSGYLFFFRSDHFVLCGRCSIDKISLPFTCMSPRGCTLPELGWAQYAGRMVTILNK